MKTVLIQGAFEILNAGHVRVFEDCKKQGDYLIVALNSNRLLQEYKGREAVLPWEEKKTIISSIRWVDKVVLVDSFSPLELLKELKVDVYCLSREWEDSKKAEIAYMQSKGGSIYLTTDYAIVRTRFIKERLLQEALAEKSPLPAHW